MSSKPSHLNPIILFAYLETCKQRQHEPQKTAAVEPTRRIMKRPANSHSCVYGKYDSSLPNEDKSCGSLALNHRH